jgi:hypothetical protein
MIKKVQALKLLLGERRPHPEKKEMVVYMRGGDVLPSMWRNMYLRRENDEPNDPMLQHVPRALVSLKLTEARKAIEASVCCGAGSQ